MATIENFATVSYTSGGVATTATSNTAEIELTSSVALTKETLGDTYTSDSDITYILSVRNTSSSPITNITVTDDLGTFLFGTLELTPLTYTGPAILLINGIDSTASLTVDSSTAGTLVFTIPTLAAGAVANIIYKSVPNEFAPLGANASITNTATLAADAGCADAEASATVQTLDAAALTVVKQMSPNPVVCGDTVTYTITLYNYGNIPAEDVRLTDTFSPAPTDITVTRNGVAVPATDYTYTDGVLTVPALTSDADTVPAATFTRNTETGEVTVSPGIVEYVITGTI
ncbi:MAG: DUF11 domain-containing protein [Clostridia bacterium]|nr:DUF11 domain-containing protein [Clostridia bacterium]